MQLTSESSGGEPDPQVGGEGDTTGLNDNNDNAETQLDALIPRSGPSWLRLLSSAAIVAAGVGLAFLLATGRVYPRPTTSGTWSSGFPLVADRDQGLVMATVTLPNWSGRDVRVTAVEFDAPGTRLVEARAEIQPPSSVADEAVTDEAVTVTDDTPADLLGEATNRSVPLPVVVPAGGTATLRIWFEPLDCGPVDSPWGVAEVNLDFGEGAFPPFSRTLRLDDDPVHDEGNGWQTVALVGNRSIEGDGPLSASCEALR
jgi:hypothetical protein